MKVKLTLKIISQVKLVSVILKIRIVVTRLIKIPRRAALRVLKLDPLLEVFQRFISLWHSSRDDHDKFTPESIWSYLHIFNLF